MVLWRRGMFEFVGRVRGRRVDRYAGTFFICWGDETLNMIVKRVPTKGTSTSPKPRIFCSLPQYPSLPSSAALAIAFRPFISPFSVALIYVSYFIGSTPRSLHISFARTSCISECLGIAERFLRIGLCHQECLAPSLSTPHPWPRRCLSKTFLFMRQWKSCLPGSRSPPRQGRPGD
uniref:Uncharacterized protein n=1 Tax=Candidatus Kentrum sp. UNK TaxID=2126344 RepID=A0A451B4H0_9GAMM|nr:MAG: hypothetical protein BECKUNK1418G_GA0071005_11683 [Candidatus Kentron sp. UNK]VFK73137.1 MAG: hypothetical protein BECKUNK1418H_GA0071006_11663 [Candidatus Kentron sp. UNK]